MARLLYVIYGNPVFCFRDDNIPIQPSSVVETWLGSDKCGMRLTVGKTYVLSGGWHINDDDELAMNTDDCDYSSQYDASVDVKMPSCENYNKRAQGNEGPVKFDIMKALGAAKRALNPFRLVCIIMTFNMHCLI